MDTVKQDSEVMESGHRSLYERREDANMWMAGNALENRGKHSIYGMPELTSRCEHVIFSRNAQQHKWRRGRAVTGLTQGRLACQI